MAITRMSNLGIASLGSEKYNDMLAGLPGVMPAPTAADGGTGTSATVSFSAVAGTTSYTAISNPGSLTGTASSSPVTVSGLTTGTAYTFQIRGNNSAGAGAYSAASNSITPIVPTAYDSIATVTAVGGETNLVFSSIPSTYKHLQIRGIARNTYSGAGGGSFRIYLNTINTPSSTSYADHYLVGNGSSASGVGASVAANFIVQSAQTSDADIANAYGASIIDINDYASTTKNKTIRYTAGNSVNTTSTDATVSVGSGLWVSTSAINQITIQNAIISWKAGTTFALYGIKG